MGRMRALSLAGAATVLSGTAFAADLPPPPIPAEPAPYAAPAVVEFSGWYLRGDVGVGFNDRPKLKTTPDPLLAGPPAGVTFTATPTYGFRNQDLSGSASFDLGIGYQFNNWLRFDVTGEYRGAGGHLSAIDQFDTVGTYVNPGVPGSPAVPYSASLRNFYTGHVSSLVAMVNGYVDLGSWYGITPYIGAGAGMSHNMLRGLNDQGFNYVTVGTPAVTTGYPTGGYWKNKSSSQFAWAVMAGLGYNVSNNLKLELGYRYLNLGNFKSGAGCSAGCGPYTIQTQRLGTHEVRLGMRWLLGEAAPTPVHYVAPPPMVDQPIVRKF